MPRPINPEEVLDELAMSIQNLKWLLSVNEEEYEIKFNRYSEATNILQKTVDEKMEFLIKHKEKYSEMKEIYADRATPCVLRLKVVVANFKREIKSLNRELDELDRAFYDYQNSKDEDCKEIKIEIDELTQEMAEKESQLFCGSG